MDTDLTMRVANALMQHDAGWDEGVDYYLPFARTLVGIMCDHGNAELADALLRTAERDGLLAQAQREIAELHEVCESKDTIMSVLNREATDHGHALSRALSTIGHLEHGISEFRRVQRNVAEAREAAVASPFEFVRDADTGRTEQVRTDGR